MIKFIGMINGLLAGANGYVLYTQGGDILNIAALAMTVAASTLFILRD